MKLSSRKKMLCLTLALLPGLFGCGADGADNETPAVRIAYFPNMIHTQALVMKRLGKLEDAWEGRCDVTWTSFNAGPAEIEAIFAGEIDIGYMGPIPAVNANVKSGGDVKVISGATNAGAMLLTQKNSGITSPKDLTGKKIAVPQIGNTQHLCLLGILKENGLSADDVTIAASSNADIANLMANGSIDAAAVPEPWGTLMQKSKTADVLLDNDELFLNGDYPSALVVASKDFIEAHPDLVTDFLKLHEEATLLINEKPDEMLEIVNEEIQSATGKALEEDVLKEAFTHIKATYEINKDAVMAFAALSKEEGFISEIPEERNVFDTEFGQ